MDIRQTQIAIKQIKDCFQEHLAKELNLLRVSAPLFVRPESGLNDDLSGVEVPVRFELAQYGQQAKIVQSRRLADYRNTPPKPPQACPTA